MINASQEFNQAILSHNPKQRALCVFTDPTITGGDEPSVPNTLMCWTDADINLSSGIRVEESVNQNSELSIGQAVSSTLSLEVFNEHGLLTNYMVTSAFTKDCSVYIGVKTAENAIVESVPEDANCVAFIRDPNAPDSGGLMVTGHDTAPYLRLEGMAFPLQSALPSEFQFPIRALLIDSSAVEGGAYIVAIGDVPGKYFGIVWEYGDTWEAFEQGYASWNAASATTWGAEMGTGSLLTYATSYFMYMHKYAQFAAARRGITRVGNVFYDFAGGVETKWEYQPLGVFKMDRPSVVDQYLCSFTAYDRMTHFDRDVSSYLDGLTYPVTLYDLLDGLCTYCGVPNAVNSASNEMLNASVQFTEKPDLGTTPSGRQLLQYIAEVSGTNARMSRSGALELKWINTNPVMAIAPSYFGIFSSQIADYTVAQIDKLCVDVPQDEGDDELASVGSGDNAYKLTLNPLILAAGSTADVTTRITPIYNRLSAYPAFRPTQLECTCNWAIQAGDSVNYWYVPAGGGTMTSVRLPIYAQTITFRGIAQVRYTNSGEPTRPSDSYAYGVTRQGFTKAAAQTRKQIENLDAKGNTYLTKTGNAYRAASIPFGALDGTSTSTVMTAQIPGITELRDGVCAYIKNGVVTSAKNFTLNVNSLGAKPVYQTMAAASRVTTTYNINYTMLFVYNSSRVTGGCWDMFYGYNTNTTYTNMSLGNGYGTCATSTAAATVLLDSFALKLGGYVSVKFTNDLPANATLAINGTAAKAVYYRGSANTAGDITAGDIATFIYDGTHYVLVANDRWGKETGGSSDSKIAYVTCSTAANTAAKTVSATGPTQTAGTLLSVVFTNGNTADTPTLSLNGATALPVYSCYTNTNIPPAAITTGMTALLLCTGSAWVLLNPKQNSFVVSSVNTSQSQLR